MPESWAPKPLFHYIYDLVSEELSVVGQAIESNATAITSIIRSFNTGKRNA